MDYSLFQLSNLTSTLFYLKKEEKKKLFHLKNKKILTDLHLPFLFSWL